MESLGTKYISAVDFYESTFWYNSNLAERVLSHCVAWVAPGSGLDQKHCSRERAGDSASPPLSACPDFQEALAGDEDPTERPCKDVSSDLKVY